MKSHMTMIVFAGVLSVALSVPASAGEKITGRTSDYQLLSEVTAAIPDKPGHILRQRTTIFKSTSNSARLGDDFWITSVAQQEVVGRDVTSKSYGTARFANGDVAYLSFEDAAKITPKEPGAFETIVQGKFEWTGGTGKHDIKGPGTYSCNFTQSGGGCEWQGEAEFSGM
jgi:hypothetical protein